MRGNNAPKSEQQPASELFATKESVKPTQFMLPQSLKNQLRDAAYTERRSMSEIVREALEQYFNTSIGQ